MSEISSTERRGRIVQPYRRPDSPYPLPQIPFRKTIALTSPRRAEPCLVNIAVDPKPIIDTESGERFVCDISLEVRPGGSGMSSEMPHTSEGATPFQPDVSADSDRTLVLDTSDSSAGSFKTPMNIGYRTPMNTRFRTPLNIRYRTPKNISGTSSDFSSAMSDSSGTSSEFSPAMPDSTRTSSEFSPEMPDFYGSSPEQQGVIKWGFCRYRPQSKIIDSSGSFPGQQAVIQGPFYRPQSEMPYYYIPTPNQQKLIQRPVFSPESHISDYYESPPDDYESTPEDYESTPEGYHYSSPESVERSGQTNREEASEMSYSPVIKGRQVPDYYESSPEDYKSTPEDHHYSSPESLERSGNADLEKELEMSYSPVIKRRRARRYVTPPALAYTPRGILKTVRPRKILDAGRIEESRSPVSGVVSPPRRRDRSMSWEKSPEEQAVIQGSFYRPPSQMSDYYESSPEQHYESTPEDYHYSSPEQ